jgi:methyl-accepting chemotaxis protein
VLGQKVESPSVSNKRFPQECLILETHSGANVPIPVISSVRNQLRFAFAIVIALSFVSSALAIWRLRVVSQETVAIAQGPLAKERLVAEWLLNVLVATKRTAFVARSADPELARLSAEEGRQQSLRTTELQQKVGALLSGPLETALFEQIGAVRKEYLSVRDRIMALKTEGKADEGRRLYDQSFVAATDAYAAKVTELLTLQRKAIDDHTTDVVAGSEDATRTLQALCVATLVASIAAAMLFARALFRRLGDEPDRAVEVANAIAAGKLRVQIPVAPGDDSSLMAALLHMRDSLAGLVGQVRSGTVTIGASLATMASDAQDLARRTESQAAALEQTASSMEQLTQTVDQSAAHAEQANQMAGEASRVARQGGAMVGELVETMDAINASSARIVDIIAVIDGIAFQTNILALNAAVEAARAGEQGRGFAVVASEVRALAQRSAGAAKEIKGLIDDSTLRIANGTQLAGQAGDTMRGIVDSIARVTGIMNDIVASTREQASGIGQVNGAIIQMDSITQQNAALVEESASATRAMHEQAAALEQLVAVFEVDAPRGPATGTAPAAAGKPAPRALPAGPARDAAAGLPVKPSAKPAAKAGAQRRAPVPAQAPRAGAAPAVMADDWEEF